MLISKGDGCSSTCTKEEGYTCTGGTATTKSTCTKDKTDTTAGTTDAASTTPTAAPIKFPQTITLKGTLLEGYYLKLLVGTEKKAVNVLIDTSVN